VSGFLPLEAWHPKMPTLSPSSEWQQEQQQFQKVRSFALDSSRLLELQVSLLQNYICEQIPENRYNAVRHVSEAVEEVFETIHGLQLKLACESMEVTVGSPKVVRLPKPSATPPLEEDDLDVSVPADAPSEMSLLRPPKSKPFLGRSERKVFGDDGEVEEHPRNGSKTSPRPSLTIKRSDSNAQESIASVADSVVESICSEGVTSAICPRGLLSPRWSGKLLWDFLVMFLVLMDATVLPYQLTFKSTFDPDDFDEAWLWITTLLFLMDVVISFNTAVEATEKDIHVAPGSLILDRKLIAKKYLRGWFAIDFGSTVPWSQMAELMTAGEGSSSQLTRLTKVVKFVRLLRLMRMLRLAKLGAIWERIEARIGSIFFVQCVALIRVLLVVIGICHWNACIFWLVGLPRNLFSELLDDDLQETYFNSPHWTTVWRVTEAQAEAWRWIDQPMSAKYVFCFYWTLGVMRTMPAEVTPVNLPERLFVLIFMFFALSAFAICVSLITQAFFKISDRRRAFNEELAAVRMHLQKNAVEEPVQMKVKAYLRYIFDRRRIQAKEANLLNILPDQLKLQVRRSQLRCHLEKIPLMKELDPISFEKVVDSLETFDLMQGDEVNSAGSPAQAAWVLVFGRLRIVKRLIMMSGDTTTGDLDVAPLIVDEHCLEDEETTLSRITAIAAESSELLRVDKEKFFKCISENRKKSLHVRGAALYHVKKSTSNGSDGYIRGRRRSMEGSMSTAIHAAAVISSS